MARIRGGYRVERLCMRRRDQGVWSEEEEGLAMELEVERGGVWRIDWDLVIERGEGVWR